MVQELKRQKMRGSVGSFHRALMSLDLNVMNIELIDYM